MSAFVTRTELRDQLTVGMGKAVKELDKYKLYMEPVEKKVLGTSNSKALQTQIDEILHEIGLIQDLQKNEVNDLNRAEAEINTLQAWRSEMPSATEISKLKVSKDDPIYA